MEVDEETLCHPPFLPRKLPPTPHARKQTSLPSLIISVASNSQHGNNNNRGDKEERTTTTRLLELLPAKPPPETKMKRKVAAAAAASDATTLTNAGLNHLRIGFLTPSLSLDPRSLSLELEIAVTSFALFPSPSYMMASSRYKPSTVYGASCS